MGSSLNPIISAGKNDVGEVIFDSDGNSRIELKNVSEKRRYNSLKFSFHSSGIRQLRMIDPLLSTKDNTYYEEMYREKYSKLGDLKSPELLFAMVSKRISLYKDYKKHLNKNKTSAVILETPSHLLNYRQVFEFYICQDSHQIISDFFIQKGTPFEYLTFKLKDNLYLYVKFVINAANNNLDSNYPDREVLFFKDGNNFKAFSFK